MVSALGVASVIVLTLIAPKALRSILLTYKLLAPVYVVYMLVI